jgi:hypothetical protein
MDDEERARLEHPMTETKPLSCPLCEGEIYVMYSAPLQYKCRSCRADLMDINEKGIAVLSEDMACRKRPAMYGGPVCECCTHAPHPESDCEFCKYESQRPEVRLMSRSTLSPRDQERLKEMDEEVRKRRKEEEEAARDTD